MPRATDHNFEALHSVLHLHAAKNVSFSELAVLAGYAPKTLANYVGKNKLAPWVQKIDTETCRIAPNLSLSVGQLKRCLSQRANRYTWEHLGVSELVSNLLDRSRTNAALALELINRPELANRIDAFVLLFCTAWEQLLKAALASQEADSIFTGDKTAAGRPYTISLGTALDRYFPDRKSAARKNLEVIKDLRDGAAHLLVPEVLGIATRYFQSGLLNYIQEFQRLVLEPPFRFEGTGLLTLGLAYSSPEMATLRVSHGSNAKDVKALISDLERQADDHDDNRFAIPLKYELVLERKAAPGAIHVVNAPGGLHLHTVKVPKDPQQVCPHTATDLATLLSEQLPPKWSPGEVGNVANYLRVKDSNNEYHYGYRAGRATMLHNYSDAFVRLVHEGIEKEPDLRIKGRQQASDKSRNNSTSKRRGNS